MFDRTEFLKTLAEQVSTIPITEIDPNVLAVLQGKSAIAKTTNRNSQYRASKRKNKNRIKNNTSLLDKNNNAMRQNDPQNDPQNNQQAQQVLPNPAVSGSLLK